jgi:O-antigen ligase
MFISEVISYGVYFDLWDFKHATKNNISPFMHHIEYSSFLAFTALILLNRIFSVEDIKLKILYSFFFITMSGNLFLTAGRTGQIALILGLYVLALISFKNKFKAVFISTVLTVLLVTAAYNYSTTFHDRVYDAINSTVNVIQSNDYCSSWGSRVGAYITAQDIILEHPVLGAGISDNMDSFRHIVDKKYPYMKCIKALQHMHNQYLQVVTQLGFVGLFFFLFIFYNLGSVQLVSREFSNMKYLYLTVLAMAFIAEVLFHRAFSLALFSFVVGLLLAQNRVENEV